MRRIADKLFGDGYHWSVLAAGRHQIGFVTMAAIMGGNIRVGLEDTTVLPDGRTTAGNGELVAAAAALAAEASTGSE